MAKYEYQNKPRGSPPRPYCRCYSKKMLGQWLEEAILEKIVRDKRRSKSQKEVKG